MPSALEALLPWLKKRFGAPSEAILKMTTDDDWTYLIKIHALLEAALNTLILSKVDVRLKPFVDLLQTSNTESGKLAWIKALGLLSDQQMQFVRIVSPIRNKIVHNVRHIEFSFADWIKGLDGSQRRTYLGCFRKDLKETVTFGGKRIPLDDAALKRPRDLFLAMTMIILVKAEMESKDRIFAPLDESTPKE